MRILPFVHAVRARRSLLTSQPPALPPAQEVAASLQKKYDAIRDFTADFVHESEGGLLRKKQTERGVVQVKKPGKMRWDYKSPEPKVFVSDGRRIYLHVPADNQVIISPVPEQDQATTAVLFLVGKGNLTRDFTVSYADGGGPTPTRCGCSPSCPNATTTGCSSSSIAGRCRSER